MSEKSFSTSELIDLEFINLTYDVRSFQNDFKIKKKIILNEISGKFPSGKLCAIIGSSGSGKSTLLNILSGYKTTGFTGKFFTNNKPRELNKFKKQSCYITQEDYLHENFTVKEAMEFAIKLKTSVISLNKLKYKMINIILKQLNLNLSCDTLIKNLSGGQRRKLSIALELIHNPSVMFFDEPTSGLDSLSTKQVVQILKEFANSGRTIICSIHQVSANELQMFDSLYILSMGGYCIYHGSTSLLPNALAKQGLVCPMYHNIADFIIEVSLGEYGRNHAYNLMKSIENGKSPLWESSNNDLTEVKLQEISKSTEIIGKKVHTSKVNKDCRNSIQFIVLLHMILLSMKRKKFYITRLLAYLFLSVMYSSVYYGIGNNASFTSDNVKLLCNLLLCMSFTSSVTMQISFCSELNVLTKEHFNQYYGLLTYYISYTVADLGLQILCTILFSLIVYYFTDQPLELLRFGSFLLIMIMVGLLSQMAGLLVGILFSNPLFSTLLVTLIVNTWVMFTGILVKFSDTPKSIQWLFDVSYLKHGLEAIMHSIYGLNRSNLNCSEIFCYSKSPSKVLESMDMSVNKYWFNFWVITIMYLFIKILTYLIIKRKFTYR
ncbi:ATP-binding cassette sub-family G member 4-like isoform X2 [Daktulosphaira vitifoliae]|nr:ATP-binding cassette sub-family G member 4-like isoform X2 [Daktulosphaira vitifoliae]XP_050541237.1 ATP-binding cassette sub-family G member 4-like isoform X2 [Daktulosphaira vitifoliae]XP_050541238.1 ATP-binding cassette sub-family G member 4-like isoform X2 [Daktulosphaira vitifoliae]XP_050541239.1 ATP-binding cassette sub-family G member 4-like isoform X2 [Daktulosphaira vitifoliae]XP_050541240.1 ATP-binding cassette sub-family G member 4-like isoform X2 [Daktulosphaira vitifoliae]XP_05